MIVADPRNPHAGELAERLRIAWPGAAEDELIYVVGGDGFLLATMHERGLHRTYFGINAGTLGFLLNDVSDWDALAEQLAAGATHTHDFGVLQATVHGTDGGVQQLEAVNDVYLERMTGQTARLDVRVSGEDIVDTLVADGLILATALGSTAYSFSAGGTAAHPSIGCLFVTPICPHKPRLPPLVLPRSSIAEVEVRDAHRRPVRAVADGRAVDSVQRVSVRYGDAQVRLAYLGEHDFTRRMVEKLMRA